MEAERVERLLTELCVELGFCLPPDANARLVAKPPSSVDGFSDAVIRAEGLEPAELRPVVRQQVRELVANAFGS